MVYWRTEVVSLGYMISGETCNYTEVYTHTINTLLGESWVILEEAFIQS